MILSHLARRSTKFSGGRVLPTRYCSAASLSAWSFLMRLVTWRLTCVPIQVTDPSNVTSRAVESVLLPKVIYRRIPLSILARNLSFAINVAKLIQDQDVLKSIKELTQAKNPLSVKFASSHLLRMVTSRLICVFIPEKSLSVASQKVVVGLLQLRAIWQIIRKSIAQISSLHVKSVIPLFSDKTLWILT